MDAETFLDTVISDTGLRIVTITFRRGSHQQISILNGRLLKSTRRTAIKKLQKAMEIGAGIIFRSFKDCIDYNLMEHESTCKAYVATTEGIVELVDAAQYVGSTRNMPSLSCLRPEELSDYIVELVVGQGDASNGLRMFIGEYTGKNNGTDFIEFRFSYYDIDEDGVPMPLTDPRYRFIVSPVRVDQRESVIANIKSINLKVFERLRVPHDVDFTWIDNGDRDIQSNLCECCGEVLFNGPHRDLHVRMAADILTRRRLNHIPE
jgi:hypothetical protein